MNRMSGICFALLLMPATVSAAPDSGVVTSNQAHSSVSILVEPQLDDDRLVLKIAAQNKSAAPVPFGPGSVTISKPSQESVAITSLQQLINDVRLAAGMKPQSAPGDAPTSGAYALRQQGTGTDGSGRMDVDGYTGGAAIAPDQQLRWNGKARESGEVASKIAALKQAILQETAIQPGQVAAGELVSEKLKFKKGQERTLNVRIRIAGDEHGFTIAAPSR